MVNAKTNQINLKDAIQKVANTELNRNQFTDLYVVNKLYTYLEKSEDIELTCDIVQLDGIQRFNNVKWVSQGLGNGKGLIIPPSVGDVVLVIFYGQTNTPLIIGNVFNTFMRGNQFVKSGGQLIKGSSGVNDDILDVGENEWILINKLNGAYIFCNSEGEIKIYRKTDKYTIGLNPTEYEESFMIFKQDGNINIQCKGGKGDLTF
jgi:hypothetical protein